MSMTLNLIIIMTVILVSVQQSQAYRYTIFPETMDDLCNDLECSGGVRHTACKKLKPGDRCSGFKLLKMTDKVINTMVLGHNGVRNKIANDFDISNMNMLHWSLELEKLSTHFLMSCKPERDVCDFLVLRNTTIGQNFYFSKTPPSERWAGRAIRSWYFELGYRIKRWDQFKQARDDQENFTEFTQMIWPTTEFVGCGAARMFDGYLATCYYHPAATHGWGDFALGDPCTKCPDDRPTCSRDFSMLCGLDMVYDSSRSQFECSTKTIFMCLLFVMWFFG